MKEYPSEKAGLEYLLKIGGDRVYGLANANGLQNHK